MTEDDDQVQAVVQRPENRAMSRKCWACDSDLSEKQKFCIKCSHWQGYLRFFNFSTVLLGLLALLVPALSFFASRIIVAIEGPPPPSLYVSGSPSRQWSEFNLEFTNLKNSEQLLPFILECQTFGGEGSDTQIAHFYTNSSRLLRANEKLAIKYQIDPKIENAVRDKSGMPQFFGVNCLGGLDAEYQLQVSFSRERVINQSIIQK